MHAKGCESAMIRMQVGVVNINFLRDRDKCPATKLLLIMLTDNAIKFTIVIKYNR